MNKALQKEIVRQVFNRFGLLSSNQNQFSFLAGIMDNQFVIDKRIVFVEEDRKYQNRIWGVSSNIEKERLNILVADTSIDIPGFTVILQMNKLSSFAVRLSEDVEDYGSLAFRIEKWANADTIVQAKCLIAIESLADQFFVQWQRLDDYKEIYEQLIAFLKFDE